MPFAPYIRSHAIYGKLSYERIAEAVAKTRCGEFYVSSGRSKNYYLHMNRCYNPVTGEYELAGCYRMYRTDILQFFKDGTCHIVTYPSAITWDEINRFGPLHCFNDSQSKFKEKRRFGSYQGQNYPIPDGEITVCKDGTIVEKLVDTYTVLDPKTRAERARIAKQFRRNALPRMMLGEFGEIWAGQYTSYEKKGWGRTTQPGDWHAKVLNCSTWDRDAFAELLYKNESHPSMSKVCDFLKEGPPARDKHHAVIVACEHLLHSTLLCPHKWSKEIKVTYKGVKA